MTVKGAPDGPAPLLGTVVRHRHRLSWIQAMALVTTITGFVVFAGATLVRHADPLNFPTYWTGLWWAVTTVTTVGYGDVVPSTTGGRLVAVCLMFVGIGCFAFMTAVAASAIVIGEEQEIEREERIVLVRLDELNARLDRIETTLQAGEPAATSQQQDRPISTSSGADAESAGR
jgi:voltage-gated potassium channel Kch